MKSYKKKNPFEFLNNQSGYALMTAMMILTLLTIIGIAATNISDIDMQIASSEKNRQQAFYAAEAGIEHARSILTNRFSFYNRINVALDKPGDWDFALDGREDGIDAATNGETSNDGDDPIGDFVGGAVWMCKSDLTGNINYTVTVWNNDDELTPDPVTKIIANDNNAITDDEDQTIYVRADGFGPNNSRIAIQVALHSNIDDKFLESYDAQSAGGQGKASSTSTDIGIVTNEKQIQ